MFWRNDYTTLITNPDVVIYNLSRPCFEPFSPIKCRLSNIVYLSDPSCACAKCDILKYNGRRLYQCNEEDFSIQVLISSVLFSNYDLAGKQREAVNWQILFVSMFMCIHAV